MARFQLEIAFHGVDADRESGQTWGDIEVTQYTCLIVRSVESDEYELWGPEQRLLVARMDAEPGSLIEEDYPIAPKKHPNIPGYGETALGIKCWMGEARDRARRMKNLFED